MAVRVHHDDIVYPSALAFAGVHLGCLAVVWTGVSGRALLAALALYVVRMFAITAGYHRYFSHRSFRTGRVFQFVLGFVAQSSGQAGVLWWAAKHRHHHRHSDTEEDVHSPSRHGFLFAHLGWIFHRRTDQADYSLVPDLARFPELRWLDRNKFLPILVLGVASYLVGGWRGLVVGFCWSTVAVYHATFAINSLAHAAGSRRYLTGDDSRNNGWLALATLGEGWHNNHHWYQGSARQGFRWWEIDPTFCALRALAFLGVVSGLKEPPPDVVSGERSVQRSIVERAAERLAESFRQGPLLHLPSLAELTQRARQMCARSPVSEEVAHRALQLLRGQEGRSA